MSYQNSTQAGPSQSSQSAEPPTTSASQNHAPSPLDWSNFMAFPSPALMTGGSGRQSSFGNDMSSFAKGIAMNAPPPSTIEFQHPYQNDQGNQGGQQQQKGITQQTYDESSRQQHLSVPYQHSAGMFHLCFCYLHPDNLQLKTLHQD
jgi:hypothetical protein